MALQLNVNSYAIVDTANAYFTDSLRSDNWRAFSTGVKGQALIEATRYLERLSWLGEKTDSAQALHFPIDGATDVPNEIIEATYEVAIRLAEDPTLIDSISNQSQAPIKRVKADTVEVEFVTAGASQQSSQLFDWVQTLVKDFLVTGNSGNFNLAGGSSVSGTGASSSFNENYDRSDGFA